MCLRFPCRRMQRPLRTAPHKTGNSGRNNMASIWRFGRTMATSSFLCSPSPFHPIFLSFPYKQIESFNSYSLIRDCLLAKSPRWYIGDVIIAITTLVQTFIPFLWVYVDKHEWGIFWSAFRLRVIFVLPPFLRSKSSQHIFLLFLLFVYKIDSLPTRREWSDIPSREKNNKQRKIKHLLSWTFLLRRKLIPSHAP